METNVNPIIRGDFPQNDVIRVGNMYYMATTTMHFYPGCTLLISEDLVHWSIAGHVFNQLEASPEELLAQESNLYGRGFRVGGLCFHEGRFYLVGNCYGTNHCYIFHTDDFFGKWEKITLNRCYHDPALFFDNGTPYLIHGYQDTFLTELEPDLSGARKNGLEKIIIYCYGDNYHSYEGAHVLKKDGRYYVFVTFWPKGGSARRMQMCYVSDRIDGEYEGKLVLDDARGYHNFGVAQGGIVETPEGKWYGILMQDYEGVGRVPVLVPIDFSDVFPVFGENGKIPDTFDLPPAVMREQNMFISDLFDGTELKPAWQWNHVPDERLWTLEEGGGLRLTSGKISINLLQAKNTLTQRMYFPYSEAEITIDGSDMYNGDVAGLCALIGGYGYVGLARENGKYYVVMCARDVRNSVGRDKLFDYMPGKEYERIQIRDNKVTFRLRADFRKGSGVAEFFFKPTELNGRDAVSYLYRKDEEDLQGGWHMIGIPQSIEFNLDHFAGCRYGLFLYSTRDVGGSVQFKNFRYNLGE